MELKRVTNTREKGKDELKIQCEYKSDKADKNK